MTTIVSSIRTRARLRGGRRIRYFPTAAEVIANGVGPFPALVAVPHADGTADIEVFFPTATAKTNVKKGGTPGTFDFFGI